MSVNTVVAPSIAEVRALAAEQPATTLHVFSGIRHVATIVEGLRAVRKAGARLAIQSEPRAREGWKGELRYLQSWLTEGWLRRSACFVLAIGRNGPAWFQSVGYSPSQIFPYAYFIDPPDAATLSSGARHGCDSEVRIGFAGRLVAAKGIFDLGDAVASLGESYTLVIAGTGSDESRFLKYCADLKVPVDFRGVVPMRNIGAFMSGLDVLVLPSHSTDDGWGVVVSEALMCGTAVIATFHVGASVLLSEETFGRAIASESSTAIAAAVRDLSLSGNLAAVVRSKRCSLATVRLNADAGAQYFLDILRWNHCGAPRPRPFYENDMLSGSD